MTCGQASSKPTCPLPGDATLGNVSVFLCFYFLAGVTATPIFRMAARIRWDAAQEALGIGRGHAVGYGSVPLLRIFIEV